MRACKVLAEVFAALLHVGCGKDTYDYDENGKEVLIEHKEEVSGAFIPSEWSLML
jgi:hypothetical protein